MSARLCKLCGQLIVVTEDFEILSNLPRGGQYGVVVIDKNIGTAHILLSEKKTQRILERRQREAEQTWIINPKQPSAAEVPTPVEETVSASSETE